MTETEARAAARKAVRRDGPDAVEIESDARVIRLDDPAGYAVEAWIYLMDDPLRNAPKEG